MMPVKKINFNRVCKLCKRLVTDEQYERLGRERARRGTQNGLPSAVLPGCEDYCHICAPIEGCICPQCCRERYRIEMAHAS